MSAGVNFYYMDYKDQLVLTGELNEIGEAMARNVPDSYRTGVELMLGVKPCRWFQWDINGTLSKNRVKNFTEKLYEDEWKNPIEVEHGNTPIAFSPDFILNNRFSFSHKGDMSMDRRHCIINVKRNRQGELVYTLRDAPSLTGTFLMNEILGDKDRIRIDSY